MDAYKQRVVEEATALSIKIDSLEKFTKGATIQSLPEVDRLLLILQLQTMQTYRYILSQRIQRF
jgi:hypothetical protein